MNNDRRVLITAGPTEEPIDPVRFLSNYSTGEMGISLVRQALKKRWKVTLILGPSAVKVPKGVQLVRVRRALEMKRAVEAWIPKCQVLIMAAAVSDWRPTRISKRKIKSGTKLSFIRLVKNPDILKEVKRKNGTPLLRIGFCLETQDLLREARKKLREKELDLIVANQVHQDESPFGNGRTTVWILQPNGHEAELKGATKGEVARSLFSEIDGAMAEKLGSGLQNRLHRCDSGSRLN